MNSQLENMQLIEGEFNPLIIVLSFIIAFGASYTAVFINKRINGKGFFHKYVWLVLASLAMGLGIWSMHYVGMNAYMINLPMEHDVFLTVVSVVPAVLASYAAFYLANSQYKNVRIFIIAGILMGCGIALMHYVGMSAMMMDAKKVYKPFLVFLSVLVASGASILSLYIFSASNKKMKNIWMKLIVSFVMATGVTSMHYIGLLAIDFYIEGSVLLHEHSLMMVDVVIYVTIGITSLLLLAYLASHLDKYMDYRVKNFDALTQLPNHNQFTEDQQVHKQAYLVAILHLNNLEKYIATFGYACGDAIINKVLTILQDNLPKNRKLYRTEPNRFTIMHICDEDVSDTLTSLERINEILEQSVVVNDRRISLEMFFAISQSTELKEIQEHFSNAIAVLKAPLKNSLTIYDEVIHTYHLERQLSLDVTRAMDEEELFIVYQPKINPVNNRLMGTEALIRWKHPEFGMISPATFIPILEKVDRISDVTDWIITKVCTQLDTWNRTGMEMPQVSINIPATYLTSSRLENIINKNLLKYEIQPSQLELEITETSVIHDVKNAIVSVCNFRRKGLSVALDDFGTGLSSLSYLKEIPINTIKIDKSFVDDVPNTTKDASILKSIIHLCYSLDLHVVIEGVETKEQIDFILDLERVPVVQGYYYSKPLTVEELSKFQLENKL